jgi:1-deoxy-D-xylulose-5-phosphate reductoisomerase
MRQLSILGSTGSIGRQTLEVVAANPERLKVTALAAGSNNLKELVKQVQQFAPELVCVPDEKSASVLQNMLEDHNKKPAIEYGTAGLIAAAVHTATDVVVNGLVGFLGLQPTAEAIKRGKIIALANKETLVAAGSFIMPMCKEYGATMVPVDSEHSAIFQALAQQPSHTIEQLILTCSGGPFRTWTMQRMNDATVDDALKHPNWSMGNKITIDSATLMNKGLEIIEALWLFDVPIDSIKVVVHPQSILHSAVRFVDGSVVGQLGVPDMRLPIHYALFYPERIPSALVPRLDLCKEQNLTFEEPDEQRFPCLNLCRQAAYAQGVMPCVLNAANEIAVDAFLSQRIKFMDIPKFIERMLSTHEHIGNPSLEDIVAIDQETRRRASEMINDFSGVRV